jgi:hypothetical protein
LPARGAQFAVARWIAQDGNTEMNLKIPARAGNSENLEMVFLFAVKKQ